MAVDPGVSPGRFRVNPIVTLVLVCLAAFGWMEWLALRQWASGHWYLADVGTIQHCLVNTWHGKFMWSPQDEGNFFAFHFAPFLLLVSPLIWLSEYPVPLVTSYVAALALTPVPIYVIARRFGIPSWLGILLGAWFLANHFTGSLELSNHFESFYVLFTLSLMAALSVRWRGWWAIALLALSVKEDAAVWLSGYALWLIVFPPEPQLRKTAYHLLGLCIAWGAMAGVIMMLAASGTESNASRYIDRMGGISAGKDTIAILGFLLISSGGLALAQWRTALLLLIPLPMILGNFEFTRHLLYYYSYPFLPFLAMSTIAGTSALLNRARARGWEKQVMWGIAALLILLSVIQFVIPTRVDGMNRLPLAVTPLHRSQIRIAAEKLPRQAPVAVQFALWGITPWRPDTVFLKPGQIQSHHYLFFARNGQFGLAPEELTQLGDMLTSEVESGRRREVYSGSNFVILSPAEQNAKEGQKP